MQKLTERKFWCGIAILINNYHAINKKIFACVINNVQKVRTNIALVYDDSDTSKSTLLVSKCEESDMLAVLKNWSETSADCEGFIIELKFLTKTDQPNIEAKGIVDFTLKRYTCKIHAPTLDDFAVCYVDNNCVCEILTQRKHIETSERWLEYVLKPKIIKWAENYVIPEAGKHQVSSLSLIDVEKYNELYKELKLQYADIAIKLWADANESTDPLKFIYEDLAIAAYLITLWRYHNKNETAPVAFADLGCGNGLLVYILNEEGYPGYGYDIRARKLWSLYPKKLNLIEQAILPNNFQPPKEVNWLIGNHSDELSAWLPVMAATCKFDMNYFVLPCCAYEFSGKKFQRRNCGTSVYQDFVQYVQDVSDKCGFETKRDRLKIPSTKRIALIGGQRNYPQSEHHLKCSQIHIFVQQERNDYPAGTDNDDIKIRNREEPVRNCTRLEKCVIDELVQKIFHLLLASRKQQTDIENWDAGGCLTMREIVQNLSKDDLQQIKAECGGIKTLLRNKHEIFEFCGNDVIGIRHPQTRSDISKNNKPQTVKKRMCFFKMNHPNGCPLKDEDCSFVH